MAAFSRVPNGFGLRRTWVLVGGLLLLWRVTLGLNAIAQFAAQYPVKIPQGLGTGMIYTNNIESPLPWKKGNFIMKKAFWGQLTLTK
jgi:hypothetical protein